MRVVSNSGPLIHLSWIDHLVLLQALFTEILVPVSVQQDVLDADAEVPGVTALRAAFAEGWLRVQTVRDEAMIARLRATLDAGEAQAVALAQEIGADLLLVDDRLARLRAARVGVPITGTLGVLRRARERGLLPAITPLLYALRAQGFWIGEDLIHQVEREERGH